MVAKHVVDVRLISIVSLAKVDVVYRFRVFTFIHFTISRVGELLLCECCAARVEATFLVSLFSVFSMPTI